MKLVSLLRALVELLTFACFLLWCFFSYLTVLGTPRVPSSLSTNDVGFVLWFVSAWWGWAALIWSESALDGHAGYPRWVNAGLLAGVICAAIAFWVGGPKTLPTGSLSLKDLVSAVLLLLLFGIAPVLLAADHLRRIVRHLKPS